MHITVLQENLIPNLQNAVRFISNKPQLSILSGIFLGVENNILTLRATDLKVGIEIKIPVKSKRDGEVVIPAKVLLELLTSLDPGAVELVTDKEQLVVMQKRVKAKIPTQAITEFPLFPENSLDFGEISTPVLASVLGKVLYAASTDETRPVLASILMEFVGQELVCVGTDGYRLNVMREPIVGSSLNTRILLPARAMQDVTSIIAHSGTKTVQLAVSKELSQSFFIVDNNRILVRLVEGEYPPYERIIPNAHEFETKLSKEEWISALKTAMVFTKDGSSILTIQFSGDACAIFSSGVGIGEHEGVISSSTKTDIIRKISFNGKYLLDALSHLESETVIFSMTDELKPCVIRGESSGYPLAVIMPFKR